MTVTDLPITIISTGSHTTGATRALRPAVRDAVIAAALLIPMVILAGAWIDTSPRSWYDVAAKPPWLRSAPQLLGLGVVVSLIGLAIGGWVIGRQQVTRRGVLGARLAVIAQGALLVAWVWLLFVAHRPQQSVVGAVLLIMSSTLTIAALWRVLRSAAVLALPGLAVSVAALGVSGGLAFLG